MLECQQPLTADVTARDLRNVLLLEVTGIWLPKKFKNKRSSNIFGLDTHAKNVLENFEPHDHQR
jgi:hypothetical protein